VYKGGRVQNNSQNMVIDYSYYSLPRDVLYVLAKVSRYHSKIGGMYVSTCELVIYVSLPVYSTMSLGTDDVTSGSHAYTTYSA
jgi:hypothetical protein